DKTSQAPGVPASPTHGLQQRQLRHHRAHQSETQQHDRLTHRRHRNTSAHDRTVGNLHQTRSDGRIPRNLPLQLLHRTVAGLGQRPHPDHHLRQRRQHQLVGRNGRLQPPQQLPCPLFHVHTPYSLRSALVTSQQHYT